jgi:hypothetical protein
MTALVLVAAAAGASAAGLLVIARDRREAVEPVLACDECRWPVTAATAHRPHEPGCIGDGCQCDRLTCTTCCDDLVCRSITERTYA